VHDVKVVFGAGEDGNVELWLGVSVNTRGKGNVRLQFIEEVEDAPGMYLLTGTTESFTQSQVEHTFVGVEFVKTTTYRISSLGRRQKTGVDVKTQTKAALDQDRLEALLHQARTEMDEAANDSD
jgi:hypothetical protein